VLDLEHLGQYTIGNRELEEELLRLFRSQLRTQSRIIAETTDAEAWRFATHTLKGVSRAIGAWAIADTAEQLEHLGQARDSDLRRRLLNALEGQIVACEREIARAVES
jgi:HPt (histidine-containing phosphotransfer) domain-containing protein